MRLSPAPDRREASERLRRAVFIDTDTAVSSTGLLHPASHAVPALCRLIDAGYLVIVAGQPPAGAAQPVDGAALAQWRDALVGAFAAADVYVAGIYACPHGPGGEPCRCRWPAPGLLHEAAKDHGIDLGRSWLVGTTLDAIESGWRAGCGSVLADVGHEHQWRWSPIRVPDFRVRKLLAAADAILAAPLGPRSHVLPRRPTIRRPAEAVARARRAA
jgi:D-glycero-D-manno-heptose 1,7-bisphosphate phosphatase